MCTTLFAVNDRRAFGACGRRIVVDDVDPAIGAYVATLASTTGDVGRTGLYRLEVARGLGDSSLSLRVLQQRLALREPSYVFVPEGEAGPGALTATRSRYAARARNEWLRSAAGHLVLWGALAFFVAVLAGSARTFVAAVSSGERGAGDRRIALLVQYTALNACVAMAASDDRLELVAFVVVPAALLLLLCEAGIAVSARRRRHA